MFSPDVVLDSVPEPCEQNDEDPPGGSDDQQGCKVFEDVFQHSERQWHVADVAAEVHVSLILMSSAPPRRH